MRELRRFDERDILRKLLRAARHHARLTQAELAARLQTRQSYVSDIERGVRRVDLVELRAICEAVGIALTEFARKFESAVEAKGKNALK